VSFDGLIFHRKLFGRNVLFFFIYLYFFFIYEHHEQQTLYTVRTLLGVCRAYGELLFRQRVSSGFERTSCVINNSGAHTHTENKYTQFCRSDPPSMPFCVEPYQPLVPPLTHYKRSGFTRVWTHEMSDSIVATGTCPRDTISLPLRFTRYTIHLFAETWGGDGGDNKRTYGYFSPALVIVMLGMS